MISDRIVSLKDIKGDPYVIQHIVWDFEPKQLMQPRCKITEEKAPKKKIKDYLFYIETMNQEPGLFLMVHMSSGYAETIAQIEEIPGETLAEAVQENKGKEYFGMYPINKKIEAWLKKEFGIQE